MDAILIVLSIPAFLLLIAVEYAIARARRRDCYRFQDSIANLGNGIGSEILGTWFLPLTVGAYTLFYDHTRVATQSAKSTLAWVILFFGVDLGSYVFHAASHRITFLWGARGVPHQREEYSLSVALRKCGLGPFFWWVFFVPLAIAGFPPVMFLVTH